MQSFYKNKRILITGACGTIGRELAIQILEKYSATELVCLDNNESALFFLEQELKEFNKVKYFLADVRDKDKLRKKMKGIDIVFHTAAFKHVIMCERSPFEAVQTNILGVQNVIFGAMENGVGKVIFTSSDKAVNPTNVMGTSKLMGERLITAANSNLRDGKTIFASTRFGNVLGSRGSVIPIFMEQIRKGGPVTLTDRNMTRFIMSKKDAVTLVIDSAELAKGGEVFVTKMAVMKIEDLARAMVDALAPKFGYDPEKIRIDIIGVKAGEKMYEELMSMEEVRRSLELSRYFVVTPAFKGLYRNIDYSYPDVVSGQVDDPYHSGRLSPMGKIELANYLSDNKLLLEEDNTHPDERYWP